MWSEPLDKLQPGEHVLVGSNKHYGKQGNKHCGKHAIVLGELTLGTIIDVLTRLDPARAGVRPEQKPEFGVDIYAVSLPNDEREVLTRGSLIRTTTQEIVNAYRQEAQKG